MKTMDELLDFCYVVACQELEKEGLNDPPFWDPINNEADKKLLQDYLAFCAEERKRGDP